MSSTLDREFRRGKAVAYEVVVNALEDRWPKDTQGNLDDDWCEVDRDFLQLLQSFVESNRRLAQGKEEG